MFSFTYKKRTFQQSCAELLYNRIATYLFAGHLLSPLNKKSKKGYRVSTIVTACGQTVAGYEREAGTSELELLSVACTHKGTSFKMPKKLGSAAEQRRLESGISQQTPRLESPLLGFGCLCLC
jgi:hypothetical protein